MEYFHYKSNKTTFSIKVFEFQLDGEKEWVAAYTVIEAIKIHSETTSMELIDYSDYDDIVEVPQSQWNELRVYEDDDTFRTLSEWIKDSNGDSGYIASTAY